MNLTAPHHRRRARNLTRVAALGAAAMLVQSFLGISGAGSSVSAATDGGALKPVDPGGTGSLVLESGGSEMEFQLVLDTDGTDFMACSGDTANDGFRVSSFMVPASVDPNTLTLGSQGPLPGPALGADLRLPLYPGGGTPWVQQNTAPTSGQVIGLPIVSFGFLSGVGDAAAVQSQVPEGDYLLGYACHIGPATDPDHLDVFYDVTFTLAHDNADPNGIIWSFEPQVGATTTTTTTTTSTVPDDETTSTTTDPDATTTTTDPATATTIDPDATTTTSTTLTGGTTTGGTTTGGTTTGGTTTGSGTPTRVLVATGSSSWTIVFWAVLLLMFGRMAILLGRTPKVIAPTHR